MGAADVGPELPFPYVNGCGETAGIVERFPLKRALERLQSIIIIQIITEGLGFFLHFSTKKIQQKPPTIS